ncbi:MAG: phosphomannomutase/phosphoglucomutase [Planctomycetota bacterium]|nr:phosphomannomutase/phosphoglucomutase [Planctomycetota bacterium]
MSIDPSESRRCPDEKYPITEAICRGRRSRHFPKCKTCKWRDVADQPPPPPVESGMDLDKIFKAYDIRGLVDSQITKTLAWKVGFGTATHLLERLEPEARFKPKAQEVVVGHDMRPTSGDLARAVAEGIRAAGVGACVIGEVETPAVYFAVGSLAALGGVMVTASHNPVTYNGFKITGPGAIPVGIGSGLEKIKEIVAQTANTDKPASGPLRMYDISSAYLLHLKKFAGEIRPMKIVVDTSNGMASKWTPSLLREYNLQVEGLNYERAGRFKHEPNPLKEANLEELKARLRASGAALGACFDGDADRVGFVDENGEGVSNDLITALLAPGVLARERGATIVYDLRSSWALREEILSHGGVPRRERVGHSFLKAAMRETNAPFGGELSGHSYYRDNYFCDNAVITLLKVLTVLSSHPEQTFSELVKPLRRYSTTGEVNFEVRDKAGLIKRLARTFSDGKVDFLDGVTVEYADWWFNCRPSNTEPLLRLCLEAKTPELRDEKYEQLIQILGEPSHH